MHHRVLAILLAASLVAYPVTKPQAATVSAQAESASAAPVQPEAPSSWWLSPELMAQGVGALVGFGTYSLLVAPQAAAAGGIASLLAGRVMAATLAAAGAVGGTVVYDLSTERPIDYAYFWYRGGFVAGLAAGIAAFGVLGYPGGGGTDWLGWAANRGALLGTGLLGAWATDRWYHGE